MRTLCVRGALALTAVGIAWSCADSSGASRPTLEELPERLVAALCPELESCLGEDAGERFFGPDGCEERVRAQVEDGDFDATIEAVEAGRVQYDGSKVDACIGSIRGTGCGFQTTRVLESESCRLVLEGSVEPGGDCAIDEDCAGVAFCKRNGAQCPGTCTELLESGEACTRDDECANGLACPSAVDRCVAPGRLGEDCGRVTDAACAAGLLCLGASAGNAGECSDPEELFVAQLGEDCAPAEGVLCVDDLACAIVLPLEAMPRFRCMERHDLGSGCTFGAPSQCPDDAYCSGVDLASGDVEGTCAKLPEEDDACNAQGGPPCAAGLSCDSDQICRPLGRLGDRCASDDACASGHCEDDSCERPTSCTLDAD
jgi:hypothetical protein